MRYSSFEDFKVFDWDNNEILERVDILIRLNEQDEKIRYLKEKLDLRDKQNHQLESMVLDFGIGQYNENIIKIIDRLIKNHKDSYNAFSSNGKFHHQTACIVLENLKHELIKNMR